jgi:sporulation protein YlmC with PRC-barrel domain
MDRRAGEYIGKTVLTLSGERLGEINNLTFDKGYKILKNLIVFDDEEEEYYIPIRSIFCHGENVVLVKVNILPPIKNTFISPINLKAYDIKGKFLGIVKDLKLDEDDKTVLKLVTDNGEELLPKNIVSHGKDAVLFDFSENPLKVTKRRNFQKTISVIQHETEFDSAEVNIPTQIIENTVENFNEIPEKVEELPEEIKQEIPKKPDNLVVGARLLTGRKVKNDIFLKNGKLLIKEGTVITLPIVNLALNNGKLFELTVNSLGNLPN